MSTSDWLFSSSDLIRLQNPSDPIPHLKLSLVLREDIVFSFFLRPVFDTTTQQQQQKQKWQQQQQ